MNATIFILVALLKTPGEGGTVQIPFDTLAACEAAGETLKTQFAAAHTWTAESGESGNPAVIYTCLEAPKH